MKTGIAALAVVGLASPALPQTAAASQQQVGQIDKRVGVLESQMRAVQRQVFPGGDKRFFAPELTPEPPAEAAPTSGQTITPLVDLTQRVTALESQQRAITGQIEELQFRMRQMDAALQKLEAGTAARFDALEGPPADPAAALPAPGAGPAKAGATAAGAAAKPAPAIAAKPAPQVAKPTVAAPVAAGPATKPPAKIEGAAAEAAPDPLAAQYEAGYALYQQGDFAAAERALRAFAEANPTHPRASNASFWAGRALMQQRQFGEAARVFYGGYQTNPKGQRAHNSLLWLARALLETKGPKAQKAACDTLDQLAKSFPDRMTGQFAADTATTRAQAQCGV
jgi:TolA-binding protein